MSDDTSYEEVVSLAIDHRLLDIHSAMPGRVEKYDATGNAVDVTPMLSRRVPTDDDDVVVEDLPVIPNVRVAWPRAGGFAITFPIQKGDYVLLVFSEAPTGAWRQTGNAGDPGDPERLGMSGAFAIPGVFPDSQNIASPSTSNMVMGKIGTPAAQIEITPTGVNLGVGATDGVASGTKNDSNLQALASAIAGTPGTVGPTEPLAVALKGAIATWISAYVNTASTKIKTVL